MLRLSSVVASILPRCIFCGWNTLQVFAAHLPVAYDTTNTTGISSNSSSKEPVVVSNRMDACFLDTIFSVPRVVS